MFTHFFWLNLKNNLFVSNMKLKLLDQLKYRVALSMVIGLIYVVISSLLEGNFVFSFYNFLAVSVLVFIPLTIIWAVVSTFLLKEDQDETSDEVIDR